MKRSKIVNPGERAKPWEFDIVSRGRVQLETGGIVGCTYFLLQQGVRHDERVTVISDGAGEFTKAVDGSEFARGRIQMRH